MNRRTKIALIAAVLLLIAALIAYFLLRREPEPPPPPDIPPPQAGFPTAQAPAPEPVEIDNPLDPVLAEEEDGRTSAEQMAELFAERYGSYSNQGNFQNLRDLLPVMTAEYRAETETFLKRQGDLPPAGTYEGVTSKKVSTAVRSYDAGAGRAAIEVTLQRATTVGTSAPEISYVVLRVGLERMNGDWKVASAAWL